MQHGQQLQVTVPGALPTTAEPRAVPSAATSDHAETWQRSAATRRPSPLVRAEAENVLAPSGNVYPPLPSEVDGNIPDIACAWAWFLAIDKDKSGSIELAELGDLVRKLGLHWKKSAVRRAFDEMAEVPKGGRKPIITFLCFARWWSRYQTTRRRDVGLRLKQVFDQADTSNRKVLDKTEFVQLIRVANDDKGLQIGVHWPSGDDIPGSSGSPRRSDAAVKQSAARENCGNPSSSAYSAGQTLENTALDPEQAWEECRKVPLRSEDGHAFHSRSPGSANDSRLGVNFSGFESYWKEQMDIAEPDIPVLPEFMVRRVGDKVAAQRAANAEAERNDADEERDYFNSITGAGERTGRSEAWTALAGKLRALTQMKTSWGPLHQIYESRNVSLFEERPLPRLIWDPDSTFTSSWDMISVVLLLYVAAAVPLRISFNVEVEIWSFAFFVELVVDLFFVADVVLNFRTAFYDENGFRESRPKYIARHYLKSWFAIDMLSCLPFGYVQYFGVGAQGGGELKGIKVIRLMKITKMIRLARLKRILMRHSEDGVGFGSFQLWQSVAFTLFTIVFLCHTLACFYYLVGEANQTLDNGVEVIGWVNSQEDWLNVASTSTVSDGTPVDYISVATRYTASMYYVLNALENGNTAHERMFGIFAEFVRDVILGLVASLITTVSISSGTSDSELELKLRKLSRWMADQKLPATFRRTAMAYFRRTWTTNYVNLPELLADCPPALASNMASLLYSRYIGALPLFQGLAPEVIAALCLRCKPMLCTKNQTIIKEGEPGKEMFIIISGEVEVTETKGDTMQRLGFLADGAFFGETPVLGWEGEPGVELRVRTVRAVSDVELVYLSREDVHSLAGQYAELRARLQRFERSGRVVDRKLLQKVDLTKDELSELSSVFKHQVSATKKARELNNLEDGTFVPRNFWDSTGPAVMAAVRLKRKAARARARASAVAGGEELEPRTAAELLAPLEDTATTLNGLQRMLESQARARARWELSMQRTMEAQSERIEALSTQISVMAADTHIAVENGRDYRLP